MKKRIAVFFLLFSFCAHAQVKVNQSTSRPWTFWWWMGSAVNETDISGQLKQMAAAGFGGVHVIPVYSVKDNAKNDIPFLSRRWLQVFDYTVKTAAQLGMGVDVTTGTGWPFGGPNVRPDMAAKKWVVKQGRILAEPTGQQVKRAAPGGEGPVLDPFSPEAMHAYLIRFDTTLNRLTNKPRAVYNDSYEAYGANWTAGFLTDFQRQHGYKLEDHLQEFLDTSARNVRVNRDYQATLAVLLRDGFTKTWTDWARKKGYISRNQAHGSPGNLLDLYALADIPETESFGSSRFHLPFLRVDEEYEPERFGTPQPLAMKFASSAANLLGKPLVSAEATTWLANHFKVSLSQIKPQLDELFTAGINHIFYHGTTYSPSTGPGSAWPGWLFYASTNYSPSSHLWPYLPQLNRYVTRCQSRLQQSKPDNDVLVYFPIDDLRATKSALPGNVHLLEVHHAEHWLLPTPFGRLCDSLLKMGYSFDYVSDDLLNDIQTDTKGSILMPGGRYRALLVPNAGFIPQKTRKKLAELQSRGVKVMYQASLKKVGKTGIRQEEMATVGLSFIRKKYGDSTLYFVANLDNRFRSGWIGLSTKGEVLKYDPLHNENQKLPRQGNKIWLKLEPGESCFLSVKEARKAAGQSQPVKSPSANASQNITGPWQLEFLAGKPGLKLSAKIDTLKSWTELSDSAGYFWGKVRYTTTFDKPAAMNKNLQLELGDVREVAEVKLNGHVLDTAWCIPFNIKLPANILKPTGNKLEIVVGNLSANYMRLRDGQAPEWKIFSDINIVDIKYKPFSARNWLPMPSGLLGPVTITGSRN